MAGAALHAGDAAAPLDPLTGVPAARLGLYLHFPYCRAKCPYCDFAVAVARRVPHTAYADAVLRELATRLAAEPWLAGRRLGSVFLGGGTPSLWEPREVGRVLAALDAALPLLPGAEVSLEANPAIADVGAYAGYRAAGVNRLSLGVQSFQPGLLRALGRDHGPAEARAAVAAARAAGFDNVALDVIYGVQGQTVAEAEADAREAAALAPEHLSAYALTVEREVLGEETVLSRRLKRGELHLPPDDTLLEMGRVQRAVWEAAGLARYEVSNFARSGRTSRHNALYWTGGEYLALGAGATGMLRAPAGALRYHNTRGAERYLARAGAGQLPEDEREALGPQELFAERLAMGLRLTGGVAWEEVCRQHGQDVASRRAEVERLVAHGLARWAGEGRLALTDAGLDVHSAVCARLL